MPRYRFVPPRPDYPAASVAHFASAALTLGQQLLAYSSSLFDFDGARCDRLVMRVFEQLGQQTGAGTIKSRPALAPKPIRLWSRLLQATLGQWRR